MIDVHCTGYGHALTESSTGNWGGKPLMDLKLNLEAALEQYNVHDDNRTNPITTAHLEAQETG